MTVYAIGDIQGCFDQLRALLDTVGFDPASDRVWFAGDLVNRGPQSLETLRFVRELGAGAVSVLGNHDLHLLATAHRPERAHHKDTLQPVLDAPDAGELLEWLRERPLLHHDPELGFTMFHAGLPPEWDLAAARRCAREVEDVLRGPDGGAFLEHMYGNRPDRWSEDLTGWERLRFITNCFTRLRYCHPSGRLNLKLKGPPNSQPPPYVPWFRVPGRASRDLNIVFGHWSTLGDTGEPGVWCVDTGCLWGGRLSALALGEAPVWHAVDCPTMRSPRLPSG